MRLSTRREFHKLREIVHFLLAGAGSTPRDASGAFICCFCAKKLDETDFTTHGNSVGPKFVAKLTIHHRNEDHNDNRDVNKSLCHTSCHKSHHRKIANAQRRTTVHVQGD